MVFPLKCSNAYGTSRSQGSLCQSSREGTVWELGLNWDSFIGDARNRLDPNSAKAKALVAALGQGLRLLGVCSTSLSEFLHVVRVVPVHKTVLTLPRSGGLEGLAAVRTWRGSSDGVRTAGMEHPELCPRNRTVRESAKLLHRGNLTILANKVPHTGLVLRSEVEKLRNVHLTLWADRATSRKSIADVFQFVAGVWLTLGEIGWARLWRGHWSIGALVHRMRIAMPERQN
jgi:hypothetical protein